MIIRASVDIRQNYNKVADLCRKLEEPVYLTKNGVGDLVVMDMNSFKKREKMLELREKLLSVEEDRAIGRNEVSVSILDKALRSAIDGASKK